MFPVCCDAIEASYAAGILVRQERYPGIVYIKSVNRYWRVSYCPHCGEPLNAAAAERRKPSVETRNAIASSALVRVRRRRCSLCRERTHYAPDCPLMKGANNGG